MKRSSRHLFVAALLLSLSAPVNAQPPQPDPSNREADGWADLTFHIEKDSVQNVFFEPLTQEENPEWYVLHLMKSEKVKATVTDGQLHLEVHKSRPLWLRILRLGM